MLKGSININNLCWNPAASSKKKKKNGKTSKNCFFLVQFAQKRDCYGSHPKCKTTKGEITKGGHQVSETFYFLKISYVLVGL